MSLNSPGNQFRRDLDLEKPLQVVGVINAYAALLAERAVFAPCTFPAAGWPQLRWACRTWASPPWKMC